MFLARCFPRLLLALTFIYIGCFQHAYSQDLSFNRLTVENGLSQNAVMAVVQDQKGFIWVATRYGLNRYDGIHFKVYKNIPGDSSSISNNLVNSLLVDSKGILWVGTTAGLNKYDSLADNFTRIIANPAEKGGLNNNSINCIYEDSEKNVWIGTKNGLNLLTDRKNNRFQSSFNSGGQQGNIGSSIRCLYEDHAGFLWVGTSSGLIRMKPGKSTYAYETFTHRDDRPESISADYITSIAQDHQQNIWIGTQHNGLNLYQAATQSFTHYVHGDDKSIIDNNIRKLSVDKKGNIWLGTQEGLSIFDPASRQAVSYQHDPENRSSLSNNSIHSIFEDRTGTSWVGTYHGGINMNYSLTTAFHVYQNTRFPTSLSNNVVSSIVEDSIHNLWIGTEGGGLNYFNRKANSFTSFKNIPGDSGSLSSNLVKYVYQDKDANILIGTSYSGGLNLLEPGSNRFRRISTPKSSKGAVNFDEIIAILQDSRGTLWVGAQSGLSVLNKTNGRYDLRTTPVSSSFPFQDKTIHVLFEDAAHQLWIGTSSGLYRLNTITQQFTSFIKNEKADNGLQSDYINCVKQDARGRIWIGTYYGGLSLFDDKTGRFSTYTEAEGLANNNVLGILEDEHGNLWLSTDNGLSAFNPASGNFKNYTTNDGLAGNKFNNNSFLRDHAGQMFFGGDNGITAFIPGNIATNRSEAPVVFTSLKLFNKPVGINDDNQILHADISQVRDISFKYNQNIFTIDFALLNFIKSSKNKYAYKLEGFEKDWNYVNSTSATYTNLPAGEYTLLVKGANNDGVWSAVPASLHIIVFPPFWRTWWAYCIYVLAIAAILFLVLRYFWLRELYKREHEMQQFKLNFFTNISHEIRTHLTLISGPVEKLLLTNGADGLLNRQLQHIKHNADRLLTLMNELMDFRKAETNHLSLHVSKENLVGFVNEIFVSFQEMAASRNIEISFLADNQHIEIYFDKHQLEKVCYNLITNAFKFTPDGGRIQLEISGSATGAAIKVKDNGMGIAPENVRKLFTNFFQVGDDPSQNTGYGIGLALSKSIVELHHGTLVVTSELATGGKEACTCFTVVLPAGKTHFNQNQLLPERHIANEIFEDAGVAKLESTRNEGIKKPLVSIVEDNAELRSFVKECLDAKYEVVESGDGIAGWELATSQIPDIIISDVMMPGMDGLELCRKLKEDIRTSHIPVILLTARAAQQHQVNGLESGADVYINKPFNIQLLELHVRNLLASRIAMREKYSQQLLLEPKHTVIETVDGKFLDEVVRIIDEHLDDEDFGVAMLSSKLAMSQPVLYKKLKALTDMSVNDFIKSIRLKKAAQLLQQKKLTVYEVAYAVGYNDRKYFSREFKKQFGTTPSDYITSTFENI